MPNVDWYGSKACKIKDLKSEQYIRLKIKNIIFLDLIHYFLI